MTMLKFVNGVKLREFEFEAKPHWDVAVHLGIFDFERAGKVTGSVLSSIKDWARLERALINFMLDLHVDEHGYTEIYRHTVNRASMTGTGQLPKFEEDAFLIESEDTS